VIEEHPESTRRARPESVNCSLQAVGAVQGFDDNGSMPEVVTPDLLDQLGVMNTFDPDPACPGDVCTRFAGID
jgi:hypothetical protein